MKNCASRIRNLLSFSEGRFRNVQHQCSVFDKTYRYEINRREISEFAHMII